jgi:hypothetical protein
MGIASRWTAFAFLVSCRLLTEDDDLEVEWRISQEAGDAPLTSTALTLSLRLLAPPAGMCAVSTSFAWHFPANPLLGWWCSDYGTSVCCISPDKFTGRLAYREASSSTSLTGDANAGPQGAPALYLGVDFHEEEEVGICIFHGWLEVVGLVGGSLVWRADVRAIRTGEGIWYGPSFGVLSPLLGCVRAGYRRRGPGPCQEETLALTSSLDGGDDAVVICKRMRMRSTQ